MFRKTFCALAALWIAGASQAEEGGQLVLEIDGENYTFELWTSQSDWSGSAQYGSVSMYANPADQAAKERFSTFTLGFSTMGGNADNGEATLTKMVDGERMKFYAADKPDEGGLALTVEEASAQGEELALSGTFTTQMGRSDNFGRDIDLAEPVEVSGQFDVVLGPVE